MTSMTMSPSASSTTSGEHSKGSSSTSLSSTGSPIKSTRATMDDGVSETMFREEEVIRAKLLKEQEAHDKKMAKERQKIGEEGSEAADRKFKALEHLLNQSKLFSNIMLSQMQRDEEASLSKAEKDAKKSKKHEDAAEEAAESLQRRTTRAAVTGNLHNEKETAKKGRGRPKKSTDAHGKISDFLKREDVEAKASTGGVAGALKEAMEEDDVKTSEVGYQNLKSARQPSLLTGGTMRKYQLEGLEWLKSLYENGLNGILADEMGLGKTIQTVSFIAFLREMQSFGPFLIAAPLSTTTNWVLEFQKWTPDIPVVLYHGSKPERAEIRRTKLRNPGTEKFPVVITSYEICMNDRKFLADMSWKYIIIDEGHRLKNLNCKLIRELQSYQSANRLLITGTPLQNNLTELWSLLHFLMPEIFSKLEDFESWFDFSELQSKDGYDEIFSQDRKQKLVSSLHAILKPFLLRRVKTDVEKMLPKKREYVLFAPLTTLQRDLYSSILDGSSRQFLEDKLFDRLSVSAGVTPAASRASSVSLKRKALDAYDGISTPNKSARMSRDSTPASSVRGSRTKKRKNYSEVSDRQFFSEMESADQMDVQSTDSESDEQKVVASTLALAKKHISNKKLQNPVMQLRLCCNSPFNFFNPFLQADGTYSSPDETIVSSSGKMLVLDALLAVLFGDGHKVLIFSQFKTQLDILGDYAELRGWAHCRIDGSVAQSHRAEQIASFNQPANAKDAVNLFLLSTRAGGQGINLAAADTVVLFDSDWNPQQDLQAQDRAHRIGQTRNVIVYRFATRGTVEENLLQKAEGKRRLEKLVIRKGGVHDDAQRNETLEDLRKQLARADGVNIEIEDGNVLSEDDLKILTDRSDEAYVRAEKGEENAGKAFITVDSCTQSGLLETLAK